MPAFWVVLAASVAVNLPDPYTRWQPGTALGNLVAITAAVVAMFLVMRALQAVLLRDADVRPRPGRAIVIFAAGAVVRALVVAALLPTIGAGEGRLPQRLATSLLIMVPLLAITAEVVDLLRTGAARRSAQRAEADELAAAEHAALARIAQVHDGVISRVRMLLTQRLEELRAGGAAGMDQALRRDVDEVIRPTSHQLFADHPIVRPAAPPQPEGRITPGDIARSASLGRPFRPVAIASVIAIASVNTLVTATGNPARGLAYTAVQWVLVFATFSLMDRFATRSMRRMRTAPRTAVFIAASVAGPAVAALLLGWFIAATGGTFAWRVPLGMAILGPLLVWVLALGQGFRRQAAAREAEQEVLIARLKLAAAVAGSALRHEERRVSLALHGPVQTAVTAAAMRIEAGDAAGAEALLVDAMGQLDLDDHAPESIDTALADLAGVWAGTCMVRAHVEPGLSQELDRYPAAAGAFIDICIEACSNAVRHGGARSVTVRAERDGTTVHLQVSDDGAPAESGPAGGMGTALLDDVAVSWRRRREGNLTVMHATLPLVS